MPHYGCGVLAAGRPVRTSMTNVEARITNDFCVFVILISSFVISSSVGSVGIEPTLFGLRDRCITLSATIPFQSARRELNPRPASYKDAALTAELRASVQVGPEGVEPTPCRLKVCCAACYTTTLNVGRMYAFQSLPDGHYFSPCGSRVRNYFAVFSGNFMATDGTRI